MGGLGRPEFEATELESSDVVVIGTPMHNLSVPSALKAWRDHVVRARRRFNMTKDGEIGTLRDRLVFVAMSSGGKFSGEHARQLDFLTPYLKLILGATGLHDLTFFSVEGTGVGPKVVAEARHKTDQALPAHFASFCLGSECNPLPSL
ncbi:NAD(P)H-dependent oxidoreductase [Paraburkholderia xenovorans]